MGDDFAMGYAMGQDSNGSGGNDWFGGSGIWGLLILALLFGYGGFGGMGWGGMGMMGGYGGMMLNGIATRADINEGFALQNITGGIRGIEQGLCDGFYAVNTGMLNGFNGVASQLANMAAQQAACCCETQRLTERGFADIGYAMATNTTSVIQNQHSDTDRVIAKLNEMEATRQAEKIEALRLENQSLRFAASQLDQNAAIRASIDAATAEILRRTGHDCPSAAYLVQPPTPVNFPVNGCGTVQFGYNGGSCGCGCNG